MKLKIVKLDHDAIVPKYAHEGDAGLDLFSNIDEVIKPHESKLIQTGIAIELPPLTEAQIRPRSGLALKNQITVLNSPGTIDSGYRGEIGVILINHSDSDFFIKKGMKIAQMVITDYISADVKEVSDIDKTTRGTGGFGSTGNR